jgi:hypothetical protein
MIGSGRKIGENSVGQSGSRFNFLGYGQNKKRYILFSPYYENLTIDDINLIQNKFTI